MAITYDSPGGDNFKNPVQMTRDPRLEYPIRQDLSAMIYVEDYCQRPDYFVPTALDTPHPVHVDAFLIAETNPKPLSSGGLVKFTRRYATVPGNRTEYTTTNFSFPAFKATSATATELRAAFSETCVAKVLYSYKLTSDPTQDLVFSPKFQPLDADENACNFVADDTTPTKAAYEADVAAGVFIQSAQTKVRRWRGNIWELQNLQVGAL
jgi:hypothetical protein